MESFETSVKSMLHLRANEALLMMNVTNAGNMKEKDRDRLIDDIKNDLLNRPQKRQLQMADLQKLLK